MPNANYAYAARPTRNPFRFLLAVWRLVRDPTDTDAAAVVEIGFAFSRLGRRFARWEEVVATLRSDPRTEPALRERRPAEAIDPARLDRLPEGSLGRVFADHCRARHLDPNLVRVPATDEVTWLIGHLYQTHDVWHVVTGWGNDEIGEYGLGAFYLAQLGAPPFFGFLMALALVSTILRRRSLAEFMQAVVAGYEMGRSAEPLFGIDWEAYWDVPLVAVRERLGVAGCATQGEGIAAAA